MLKFGFAVACVTIVGKPITASTTWITPLSAIMSADVTLDTPFYLTPEAVLINILNVFVEEALPVANVLT